jgi:hypothetical protein
VDAPEHDRAGTVHASITDAAVRAA